MLGGWVCLQYTSDILTLNYRVNKKRFPLQYRFLYQCWLRHCPQRKLSGASWPAEGWFYRGEGEASSMQGVEVTLECGQACTVVRISCLTMCASVFVCTVYSRCEQKAQVRKDMHDLLTALWCTALKKVLCNWNQHWTNVGLCDYLPRSKTFFTHPFQRKHCIRHIYILQLSSYFYHFSLT